MSHADLHHEVVYMASEGNDPSKSDGVGPRGVGAADEVLDSLENRERLLRVIFVILPSFHHNHRAQNHHRY